MIQVVMICAVLAMSDGDSGRCDGQRVRLSGIDAVEVAPFTRCRQRPQEWACRVDVRPFGTIARDRARDLASAGARCEVVDRDQYRRLVVRCAVNGRDLGGALVREGLAVSERAYGDLYRAEENAARRDRLGVWR
jgi:endonuclease YncB( thermonuclease family)